MISALQPFQLPQIIILISNPCCHFKYPLFGCVCMNSITNNIIIMKPLRYPGWSNASLVQPSFGEESLWKTVISCQKKKVM